MAADAVSADREVHLLGAGALLRGATAGPLVHAQGKQGEIEPVEVVVEVENAGEARAGELVFFPVPVGVLTIDEELDAAARLRRRHLAAGEERHDRPGGLRRRAGPDAL